MDLQRYSVAKSLVAAGPEKALAGFSSKMVSKIALFYCCFILGLLQLSTVKEQNVFANI